MAKGISFCFGIPIIYLFCGRLHFPFPYLTGETSFEFITQMVDNLQLKPNDCFVDLGSGVGQVVLQVAASVPLASCIGIEKADVPCTYSQVR